MKSVAPMQSMDMLQFGVFAALAVLALLIAGVVVLFVTLRAKAWWIVGPVLGLVVLAVLGLRVLHVPSATPARQVTAYPATPEHPHSVSVSDIVDGNSARGIASGQTYYNEDGSAYVEPSGADLDLDLSPGSGRGGLEPMRVWTLGGVVLVGLLIAGVVLLFVKLRAKAWWIVAPVLGLGLLVVLAGGLFWTRPSYVSSGPSRSYEATYSRTSGGDGRNEGVTIIRGKNSSAIIRGGVPVVADSSDSVSADRISETFLADVYPSALQAAEALAAHVARSFHSSPDQSTTPRDPREPPSPAGPGEAGALPDILVAGQAQADATILQAVADALRKGAMARRVIISSGDRPTAPASQPATSAKQIICAVRVFGQDSGTVQIILESPDKQTIRSARFVYKPWVVNFPQYVASSERQPIELSRSKDHLSIPPVLRAGSAAAASFEEAQEDAFQDAARKLAPYVKSAMMTNSDAEGEVDAWVTRQILAELRLGTFILDRFNQQFDRPYGNLWRVQLLIDASPKATEPVAALTAKKIAKENASLRHKVWTLTVSLGGMAVLIFAVYLVLNAATKGYYTWVLRLLAIGAIIAALAVMG